MSEHITVKEVEPIKRDKEGNIEARDPRFTTVLSDLQTHYARIETLESQVRSLRAAIGAKSTGFPFDLGHTYYPPGDAIPNRGGPAENFVGQTFIHPVDGGKSFVVAQVMKNDTGIRLSPKGNYKHGIIDSRLSHDVEQNDYYWLEIV